VATKIWCGKYLEIDNLIIHPLHQSSGIGTALLRHLEQFAGEQGCNILVLDSYTSNHASHRLYHRLGFEIWGFHFIRPLRQFEH
jgi:ribosomal protein S18 acetylase RimI-like enzyme